MSGFLSLCLALQRPLPYSQHAYTLSPTHHVVVMRERNPLGHSPKVQGEGVPHTRGPMVQRLNGQKARASWRWGSHGELGFGWIGGAGRYLERRARKGRV